MRGGVEEEKVSFLFFYRASNREKGELINERIWVGETRREKRARPRRRRVEPTKESKLKEEKVQKSASMSLARLASSSSSKVGWMEGRKKKEKKRQEKNSPSLVSLNSAVLSKALLIGYPLPCNPSSSSSNPRLIKLLLPPSPSLASHLPSSSNPLLPQTSCPFCSRTQAPRKIATTTSTERRSFALARAEEGRERERGWEG